MVFTDSPTIQPVLNITRSYPDRGLALFAVHPGHEVAVGIQEPHPRPRREDDDEVDWDRLVVFVSVDDLEGLGEGQKMYARIGTGNPAHAAQIFAAEDVAGDMPAKQSRLRCSDLRRNLPLRPAR